MRSCATGRRDDLEDRLYAGRVVEDLWVRYQAMGTDFARHAEDSAYNAHYDRPAVLAALGPVQVRRVLDAGERLPYPSGMAFAELHRVLVPGGRLVVSTTHPACRVAAHGWLLL